MNQKKWLFQMMHFFIDSDPVHSFQAIREQIFGSINCSVNPALMNGFSQQTKNMSGDMLRTVMSGFKPSLVSVYTELANEFAVLDRWFTSVPASTQPNQFYVHSATSHGATSNVRKDLIHGFPKKTIFDSLDENDLSFGIYYQNIPATLFFRSLRKLKQVFKFHDYSFKFKLHAILGNLPNYAVIEQRYFNVKVCSVNDNHPSHDMAHGQRVVKEEVYEILKASPQWKEMAMLITYDGHGGFYNHVPTPVENVPNSNSSSSFVEGSSSSSKDLPPLSATDRIEHQRRKVKLLSMLDEVDRRHNHYCKQMQMAVNSFDLIMGFGATLRSRRRQCLSILGD